MAQDNPIVGTNIECWGWHPSLLSTNMVNKSNMKRRIKDKVKYEVHEEWRTLGGEMDVSTVDYLSYTCLLD
jgi:hypothetical protein